MAVEAAEAAEAATAAMKAAAVEEVMEAVSVQETGAEPPRVRVGVARAVD